MAKSKKVSRGRYHVILMSCGYVEHSMTSWLIFSTRDISNVYFKTPAEAVTALALDLYEKYLDELSYETGRLRKCCKDFRAVHSLAKHCIDCGTKLLPEQFDELRFMDFVSDLHCRDCDAYGEAEHANGRDFMFWPFRGEALLGAKKNEYVFIAGSAEEVIRDALLEAKPELEDPTNERVDTGFKSNWDKIKETGTSYED